jgi:ParB family chromosome partitioning protein
VANSGLGRGLASLISGASAESNTENSNLNELAIDLIEPNPNQPRTEIDEESIAELSASVALHGLLQPLLVRAHGEKYEIVAGERRWRASRLAGLKKVPVRVVNLDDTETLEVALIENLQREDLNSLEEAYGYKRLLEQYGMTQEDLAKRLSKSRVSITNALRLLDLPEEVQSLLYEGKLTAGHARALLALPDDDTRIRLAQRAVESNLSVRDVEAMARLSSGGTLPRSPRPVSPKAFKTAARRLRKLLGTNVRVKQTKDRRKIEIEFQDETDLVRIYQLLTNDKRALS